MVYMNEEKERKNTVKGVNVIVYGAYWATYPGVKTHRYWAPIQCIVCTEMEK